MAKSKEYKNVKNYIHNDLQISREYVEQLTMKTVEEQVNARISNYMESNDFQRLVVSCVGRVLGYKLPLNHVGGNAFSDTLQTLVKQEIKNKVSERIDVVLELNSK